MDFAVPGQKAATVPLVSVELFKGLLTSTSLVRPVQMVDGLQTSPRRPASAPKVGFSPHSHLAGWPQGRAALVGSISPACHGQMFESFQTSTKGQTTSI